MKIAIVLAIVVIAVVSAGAPAKPDRPEKPNKHCPSCDESFRGFGTEPGKCGCCPWPCGCKCIETESCPPPEPTTTTPEAECPCLDLAFVVDASGSIGTFDWQITLQFLRDIITVLNGKTTEDRCQNSINIAVVTFSNNATVHIPLTDSKIVNINPATVPQDAELTNIVEGIEVALDQVFSAGRSCKRFVVMLTDGRSNFRIGDLPEIAARLQNEVHDAVCIGITNKIDVGQLSVLCPQETRRLSVNGFNELIDLLLDQIYDLLMETMTTVEVPEPQPCLKKEQCFCCCTPEQFWGISEYNPVMPCENKQPE